MSGAIDESEYITLTEGKKSAIRELTRVDDLNPFGFAEIVVKDVFGSGATLTALAALRVKGVSRANELGYPGEVKVGHVEMARAQ